MIGTEELNRLACLLPFLRRQPPAPGTSQRRAGFYESVTDKCARPTGQKRGKEDWENIYYYGFGGSMLLGAVLIYYKPDTSSVSTSSLPSVRL